MKLFIYRVLPLAILLGSMLACTAGPGATLPPPTPTAVPAAVHANVLPAPLYYLGANCQIWRLEPDGVTRNQVTHETAPVNDFDVSLVNGALVYAVSNDLVRADADGANRTVVVAGPPLPPDSEFSSLNQGVYLQARVSSPRWSPDGAHIAFIQNGVNWVSVAGGKPEPLLANPEVPGSYETPLPGEKWISDEVIAWSPDGTRMLVRGYDFPIMGGEDFRMAVLSVVDHSLVRFDNFYAQNDFAWSADGEFVYVAGQYEGIGRPGLWRVKASTGQSTELLPGQVGKNHTLVTAPYQPKGDRLYFFMTQRFLDLNKDTQLAIPRGQYPLGMYRSGLDGDNERTTLRGDAHTAGVALWAWDGSGAVVMEMADGNPLVPQSFTWLPADGESAVELAIPVPGCSWVLRWGVF